MDSNVISIGLNLLSSAIWDSIKQGAKIANIKVKDVLKGYLLDETSSQNISNHINSIPENDISNMKNEEELKLKLSENNELRKLLSELKPSGNLNQQINNNGAKIGKQVNIGNNSGPLNF